MTVIAADLVPITPYTTTVLNIGMGQRYDIVVTADQASLADKFWLRAIPQSACSDVENSDDIRGIIYYSGADTSSLPTTSAYDYTDSCADETSNLTPYISKAVGTVSSTDGGVSTDTAATVGFNSDNLFRWYLNSTNMLVEWANPSLSQVLASVNSSTSPFTTSNAIIELPDANQWIYLAVHSTLPIPHPIHLHGHDYFILAQGTGTYDADTVTLNKSNPPRRDTAMLPAAGYLVLAFETDNPGAWLMHCHIGW